MLLNKPYHEPIRGVKGFKGWFDKGHLKSIPDWFTEKLSR
jgi:hypothetical protein